MRTLDRFVLSLLSIALLLNLATCGATPEPARPQAATEVPAPTAAAVAATAAPAPAISSIVIAIPEDPPSFNASVGDTGYDALVMELALLGLADLDPDGNFLPELAAELPTQDNGGVVIDEDAWTMDVTWRLRDDVLWSDGTPVTAADVLFTYEAIVDPATGLWVPGIDYVDSVEVLDDHTVVIHYNYVYPGYMTQFGGEQLVIWPAHYCDADQGFVAWDCGRQPLSTGPYVLQEWQVGNHMTFVRNPNYYEAGKPGIDQVIVRIVPDPSVAKTMLLQGDVDVYMWATESMLDDLEGAANVRVSMADTSRWVMRLFPNQAARGSIDPEADPHPILADVQVRHAIRHAIDVDAISQQIFRGYGEPVWTEFFRPPYQCDVPRPSYDPDIAMALLQEAGWTDEDGDGVRECHGCLHAAEGDIMSLELMTYAEYGEVLEMAQQLIGEMLGQIGIDVRLSVVEGSVMWADYESGGLEQVGDFDLNLWDDGYSGVDPTDFLWELYYSTAAEPDSGWNVTRWINGDLDALLDEAYTLDEEYRQELFCEMAQILEDELPVIMLFSTVNADAYSARIRGVQSTVNDLVTWNVADWTLGE
jgi:peptide/nickel transport system substrate-binding protein